MTNKNVIEIINRLMDQNTKKRTATANEVFTAIIHGYYYIRPGKNTSRFLKKISKILSDNWKDRYKMYDETKDGFSFDVYLMGKMAGEVLSVARSMFDEEYYASQIQRMPAHEEYDKSLLKDYLYWLSDEELKSVFEEFLTFKLDCNVFISDENLYRMMEEFKECAINVIQNDALYMKDYDEHIAYINGSWDFPFEYLCRETIIYIIYNYVDEEPVLFASMIKAFKYAGLCSAVEYTALAIWFLYGYDRDLFEDTEPADDDPNNTDGLQLWQVRSRTVGKVKFSVMSM